MLEKEKVVLVRHFMLHHCLTGLKRYVLLEHIAEKNAVLNVDNFLEVSKNEEIVLNAIPGFKRF